MDLPHGNTDETITGSVNAAEGPHIKPETSRRQGSKRSADGDIDQRSRQKQRLSDGQASPVDGKNGDSSLQRTASEEFMNQPGSDTLMDRKDSQVEEGAEETEDAAVDGSATAEFPNPDQIAPLAEFMVDEDGKPLSKNQMKKRRKQAEWEAKRDDRKAIRKEKLVAKKERRKAARQEEYAATEGQPKQKAVHRPRVQLPVTFLIDCDFDNLMLDKERKSLASQVTRSYSDTRKAEFYPHLAVCSFGGELKERFDTILTHYKGWKGIRFLDEDFVDAGEQAKQWMSDPAQNNKLAGSFSELAKEGANGVSDLQSKGEVIYLTSESPYTLTALKPYSTYIIGGLVDKNREKGICYRRATERGVKTAKLPIGEFLEMSTRKVLATNHVNEIMLKWLECGDWGEAFMKVIPKRKGGKLKGEGGKDGDEDGDGDEDEDDSGGEGGHEDGQEGIPPAIDVMMNDENGKREEFESTGDA